MPRNNDIGGFLAAKGCTQDICWGSSPHVLRIWPWNAVEPWDGQDARVTYRRRYGYVNEGLHGDGSDPAQAGIDPSLFSAGTTVGEISGAGDPVARTLQDLARRADNPFNLRNHAVYVVTAQDAQDVRVVKDPNQNAAVYMTIIADMLHDQARQQPDPPANIVPGVSTPPVTAPVPRQSTPIPIVPPPPSKDPAPPPAPSPTPAVDPILHLVATLLTLYLARQNKGDASLLQQLVPLILGGQIDPATSLQTLLGTLQPA